MTRDPVRPYLWMLGGSFAFAVMGTLTHLASRTFDWPLIATVRAALPLVLVLGLARVGRVKLVLWRPATLWLRSVAGSLSLLCVFYSLKHMPITDVLTLTNMFPIWVAVLSWPVLGEVPEASVWVAVASGVAGIVLIQQPHLAEGNFAALLALAASLCSAVAMLGLHRLRGIDARAIVVHFSLVAVVFAGGSLVLSLVLVGQPQPTEPLTDAWPLVWLLGIGVSATVGQLCLTKAFSLGEPAKVSVVGLTQIVFGMGFDVVLLQHGLTGLTLLGVVLVIAPTAWLLLRRAGRALPPAP